jgi:hypothetical protein
MIKTAQEIVQYFSTLPADQPVHIEWFEKEEAEVQLGEDLTDETFKGIFEFTDDQGFIDTVSDALYDYQTKEK